MLAVPEVTFVAAAGKATFFDYQPYYVRLRAAPAWVWPPIVTESRSRLAVSSEPRRLDDLNTGQQSRTLSGKGW